MIGKPGRPKGSRNALDAYSYACALAHARHKINDPPPEEFARTSLWSALEVTLKRDPPRYVQRIISILPKQVSFESSLHNLDDEEIDNLIIELKARALEAKEAPLSPLLLEAPRVINGQDQSQ